VLRNERYPWFLAKGQDHFLPISNFVSSKDIKDPHNLQINLYINDELRQSDNTGNMHFKIGEIIEFLSKYITLIPGDLVLTGTPFGIGLINLGDQIKANLKQDNNVIVEMNYEVVESDYVPRF
jgi:acylpyruvate hydrolase